MKHLDEYRDSVIARQLIDQIRHEASRQWVLMEVCGGQTHSLLKYGIESELGGVVELVHGPGCPVCVTPLDAIDYAQELARRPDVILTSFGDMLRVPGSRGSLLDAKTAGANVRMVYSPVDAVEFARKNPGSQVVFFAVGFETTVPATALAVKQAAALGVENFSLLVAHVRVQPAMESIMLSPNNRVDGFLAAGHVCTVIGANSHDEFVERFRVPVVVTGFEPVDLLTGIRSCVRQLESGQACVENCYTRCVRTTGNPVAKEIIEEVFQPCDRSWRGLGTIPLGGLELRDDWKRFDATARFSTVQGLPVIESEQCRSAEVLAGRIKPVECPAYGKSCNPESPLGAPMVSSEGACAAYYRYSGT